MEAADSQNVAHRRHVTNVMLCFGPDRKAGRKESKVPENIEFCYLLFSVESEIKAHIVIKVSVVI